MDNFRLHGELHLSPVTCHHWEHLYVGTERTVCFRIIKHGGEKVTLAAGWFDHESGVMALRREESAHAKCEFWGRLEVAHRRFLSR